MDAARVLPQLEGQLERVRDLPIREIQIEFDPPTFFGGESKILELRLELNPLFTQPMSIFFAQYAEGRTWPPEFKFEESPHTSFPSGTARVDAKFRWFDRVANLTQVIDGTDTGVTPKFILEFDGEGFVPGGRGIHLRQEFQVPSLQKLIDDKVRFRLIQHDPIEKKAAELSNSNIDLRVRALHRDAGPVTSLVLFDTRQDQLEKAVSAGDYLVNRGPIERSVLLNLYPPILAKRIERTNAKRESVKRLLETRNITTDDDRRQLARVLTNEADLSAFRGDHSSALNAYNEVTQLLTPLVLESVRTPRREDGENLFNAALQPVAYFVRAKRFENARPYLRDLSLITDRLIASNSKEPDYVRWRATGFLQSAAVALGLGLQEECATTLQHYVDSYREIHRLVDKPSTGMELAVALDRALKMSTSLADGLVPIAIWREQEAELRSNANRVVPPK
jgi:hypothetical protein